MSMLENRSSLTINELNDATQAWIELGYNRSHHDELGSSPYDCFAKDDNDHRPCPDGSRFSEIFTRQITRSPRRFDATIVLDGIRFSIPWQYRHIKRVIIRYASWDLSSAWLMDQDGEKVICRILPLDRRKNADGLRRIVDPFDPSKVSASPPDETAPLLQKMLNDQTRTGLPSAWIPVYKEQIDEK